MSKQYLRDGRAPYPKKESTSKVMSANRAKNSKPEVALRKALWQAGFKGYRLHWKNAPGRPDICWPAKKQAIFVHGCYWHRCPHCDLPLPKSNTDWWQAKFERNQSRDKRKENELIEQGWTVTIIWECQINNQLDQVIERLGYLLKC